MQVPATIHLDIVAGPTPGQVAATLSLVGADGAVYETSAVTPLIVGQSLTYGPVQLDLTPTAQLATGKTVPPGQPRPKK